MEKQLHRIENGKIISGAFLGAGLLAYVLSAVVLPLENK